MNRPITSPVPPPAVKVVETHVGLQLLSFGLVGGVAALAYTLLTAALIELHTGIPNAVIGTFCYALFIGPVYLAHRRLSFRSGTPHAVALPRYIAVQLSALLLAALFSQLAYSVLDLSSLPGAFLVIVLTSGVNFAVLKLWAFAADR